jgi:hypothetical protein
MQSSTPTLQEALLDELRQVSGVVGSMLVSTEGELVLQRLPGEMAARARDAAPRLAVLLEALAAGKPIHSFCLRFFEHRLHVVPVSGAFLCVLSELWSSSPVLKMAMHVTGRRFS